MVQFLQNLAIYRNWQDCKLKFSFFCVFCENSRLLFQKLYFFLILILFKIKTWIFVLLCLFVLLLTHATNKNRRLDGNQLEGEIPDAFCGDSAHSYTVLYVNRYACILFNCYCRYTQTVTWITTLLYRNGYVFPVSMDYFCR